MPYTEEEKKLAEESKLLHDYLKHLSTLCTGSILIIAAFLEKIITHPAWKFLVAVSIASFLVSVVGTVAAQTFALSTMHEEGGDGTVVSIVSIFVAPVALIAAWAGFLVGIVSIGVFAIKNL
jgi:hypothetical protein